ncbi:hypothetical protein DPMN_031780 [Dreissena polymorpha]|uniref:LRAT domain-containing protein n=1 Tax=Dreissena polymorpha TaxID=45954 RepID=A0A9D4M3F0_DREPO|nr:hypothetical protein DPMN_031780 [Dreissena polymorpha]
MRLIRHIGDIKVGDVIVYKGIVAKVTQNNEYEGFVDVIHYGADSLFAKRTVAEECTVLNLRKQAVYVMSFDCRTFEADIVVQRARSRLGEKRHNLSHNTSLQFVEWAKAGKHVLSTQQTTYGTLHLYNVYSWCDLQKGSIVEFTYYGLNHQGIPTDFDEEKKTITVIHYGAHSLFATNTVMEDILDMDLKTQSLKMYRCGDDMPFNEPDVVVRKAKERLGEQNWRAGNRSWDFCLQCLFVTDTENEDILDNHTEFH